jgi:hypothetical protein
VIDIMNEQLWSMDEAAAFAKVHRTNIYAWTSKGCRGVVLESVQIGAKRFTSKEAVTRFVATLNDPRRVRELRTKTGGYITSKKKREQESKKAGERLKKAGA